MASDGPTPAPCDPEIFQNGTPVAVLTGRSNAVERWVKSIAEAASARIDWHYSGGRAQVLHLGDAESKRRVLEAMRAHEGALQGTILELFESEVPGLYRQGVTEVPPGTIAAFYEDGLSSTYIIDPNSTDK